MMSWFTGLMYMIPATGMIVYAAIVELFTKPFSIYLIIKVIYGVVFWEIMSFVGFIITPCAMKDFKQKPGMTKFPKHPVS